MFGGFNQSINIVVGAKEKKIIGPIIVATNKILRNSENWSLALGLGKCKTNGSIWVLNIIHFVKLDS